MPMISTAPALATSSRLLHPSLPCAKSASLGHLGGWAGRLCAGLQIHVDRFDSGTRLQNLLQVTATKQYFLRMSLHPAKRPAIFIAFGFYQMRQRWRLRRRSQKVRHFFRWLRNPSIRIIISGFLLAAEIRCNKDLAQVRLVNSIKRQRLRSRHRSQPLQDRRQTARQHGAVGLQARRLGPDLLQAYLGWVRAETSSAVG